MTLLLSSGKLDNFRTYLEKNGYTFEDRPYQLYLAKKSGIVINLYSNGKIVIGGADQAERTRVEEFLGSLEASQFEKPIKQYLQSKYLEAGLVQTKLAREIILVLFGHWRSSGR